MHRLLAHWGLSWKEGTELWVQESGLEGLSEQVVFEASAELGTGDRHRWAKSPAVLRGAAARGTMGWRQWLGEPAVSQEAGGRGGAMTS